MGIPVLILGESGSGKSTSLRNFEPSEISIFNVAGKPLPFRKKLPKATISDYGKIMAGMQKSDKKSFAIDDSQYLLCFEMFSHAKETGYQKFTDIALNFYTLIKFVIDRLPDDVIVYFLHHTETDANGKLKAKTVGKMLDEKLTVEGLFSIVLLCQTDGTRHYFVTQSDGYTTAKSPMDMFDLEIDNDLKFVDTKIREYFEI
ncbi:AAA family ATPase [Oscillospiraceae bacterium LCP21S3_A1]